MSTRSSPRKSERAIQATSDRHPSRFLHSRVRELVRASIARIRLCPLRASCAAARSHGTGDVAGLDDTQALRAEGGGSPRENLERLNRQQHGVFAAIPVLVKRYLRKLLDGTDTCSQLGLDPDNVGVGA